MPADEVAAAVARRVVGWPAVKLAPKHLHSLAVRDFRVSEYAAARRLKELGLTEHYLGHASALFIREMRTRKPSDPERQITGLRVAPLRFNEIGVAPTSMVFNALRVGLIDSGTASGILRIRADKLPELEAWARQQRRSEILLI